MTELAVQSAAAFLAIFGFSIILDVPKKFLLYAGAAGGVCWFVYLLALQAGRSLIMAAFLSSLVVSILSHIFARVLKAPVTVFLVAGILPTVPGASVYRCVYFMIQGLADLSTYHLGTDHTDSRSDGACHIYCGFIVPPGTEDLDSRFGGR